jgi:hypothetical protein
VGDQIAQVQVREKDKLLPQRMSALEGRREVIGPTGMVGKLRPGRVLLKETGSNLLEM